MQGVSQNHIYIFSLSLYITLSFSFSQYTLGLTNVSLRTYFLDNMRWYFARGSRLFLLLWENNWGAIHHLGDIMTPQAILSFLFFGLLLFVTNFFYKGPDS